MAARQEVLRDFSMEAELELACFNEAETSIPQCGEAVTVLCPVAHVATLEASSSMASVAAHVLWRQGQLLLPETSLLSARVDFFH